MNVDRMRAVANLIELEDRFYYGEWVLGIEDDGGCGLVASAARLNECGTTGCVAGWATHLGLREWFRCDASDVRDFAAEYLDLDVGEAYRLFFGRHFMVGDGSWRDTSWRDTSWRDTSAVEVAKFMRAVADGETTL